MNLAFELDVVRVEPTAKRTREIELPSRMGRRQNIPESQTILIEIGERVANA